MALISLTAFPQCRHCVEQWRRRVGVIGEGLESTIGLIRGLAIRVKVRREVRDKNENKLATPEETCRPIRYSQQFKQV